MNFLTSLLDSPIAVWVQSSEYGYYLCLVGHAVGMAIVVGTVIVLCVRVLGYSVDQPLPQIQELFRIAWAGFALNLLTGVAMFMANGPNLVQNPPFLIKIGSILIGGLCLIFLWRQLEQERTTTVDTGAAASATARTLACITLGCWMIAIMAGRLIAYTINL